MMITIRSLLCASYLVLVCASVTLAEDWTRFRGPNGSGVSSSSTAPTEWSEDKNLKWSFELPGPGSSCPIVVDNKVLLTCYTGYGIDKENPGNVADLKRHLLCFDRNSGEELWRATVDSTHDEDPYTGFIQDHGYASSTPVSDGHQIFVLFGKTGMVAFDMEGNQRWLTHLGSKSDPFKWGSGASPVLHDDLVIVNAGIEGHKIVALKQEDGSEAWAVEDDKFTNCWSTPIKVKAANREELVFSMPGKILAFDPDTGKELWRADSPIAETVCGSLCENDGVVFAMGGRQGSAIGIKCGGEGDVTDTHTVWKGSLRSGIGTPLVYDGNMYWTSSGIAYCADCETGEYVFKDRWKAKPKAEEGKRRRPAGDYGSPVQVGGNIVMLTRNGTTYVIKPGDTLEMVSENSFAGDDSQYNSTPAVSEGQIFIRSNKKLYCIDANKAL